MKDMPMKRILRYALAIAIVLTIAAYSNPANAETGIINVSDITEKGYVEAKNSGPFSTDFTKIYWKTGTYNYISWFRINDSQSTWVFTKSAMNSRFTITSGGTGSGYAYYGSLNENITWVFDSDATMTSSPLIISYEDSGFMSSITRTTDVKGTNPATEVSDSIPLLLCSCEGSPYIFPATYYASVESRASDRYNITYPFIGGEQYFNLNVTKGGVVQTKHILTNYNESTIINQEATFNTNNYDFLNLYPAGLVLNVTLASGEYTKVVLNSSGASVPATPNTPSDNIKNGVGLAWEFSSYTIDTTGNLTWSKTTPNLACDKINIYDPDGQIILGGLTTTIPNPNDDGFFKVLLDKAGTWKADYIRQTLCYLSNEEILNTAYTTVPAPQPSYLIINATTIAGRFENVTYLSGTRLAGLAPQLKVLDALGNVEGSFDITGFQTNVEGVSPVVIITSGQHTIRICDAWGCDDVVAVTNTVFNNSIPTTNITISNITLDNTVYSFEDHAIVKYAVDNYNFSNKAIYTTSYNWDHGIETTRYVGFVNQTGTLDEHFSIFLGKYTYPGTYSYRLMGRNDTGAYILSYWNFTISTIDNEGYGLSLSKDTLCLGESITMIVNSPAVSYLNISHNTNGNIFNSYSINMNKTITYKPSAAGTYTVILYSPEGYTKRDFLFTANACVTPTPTPGTTQGATQAKAMANMLMSNVFWSFIITAGLMIAIAWRTRHGMATVAIGALSMAVFAAVGWFPLWAFFSIVIIAALLLSAKWAAQFFDIGTSD